MAGKVPTLVLLLIKFYRPFIGKLVLKLSLLCPEVSLQINKSRPQLVAALQQG